MPKFRIIERPYYNDFPVEIKKILFSTWSYHFTFRNLDDAIDFLKILRLSMTMK